MPPGTIGRRTRTRPYVPIFSSTPASSTEPTVGAEVCASGSQLCSGQAGALTARPMPMQSAAMTWVVWVRPLPWAAASCVMSKVPALVPISRKPSSITAEPSRV